MSPPASAGALRRRPANGMPPGPSALTDLALRRRRVLGALGALLESAQMRLHPGLE